MQTKWRSKLWTIPKNVEQNGCRSWYNHNPSGLISHNRAERWNLAKLCSKWGSSCLSFLFPTQTLQPLSYHLLQTLISRRQNIVQRLEIWWSLPFSLRVALPRVVYASYQQVRFQTSSIYPYLIIKIKEMLAQLCGSSLNYGRLRCLLSSCFKKLISNWCSFQDNGLQQLHRNPWKA